MIKAIETVYKGYKFRSRLEARWAVFFDVLGIKYEYEKEGFELENGDRYLPDFYLPDTLAGRGCWVEIKPLTDNESGRIGDEIPDLDLVGFSKMLKLTDGLDNYGLVIYGNPYPNEYKILDFLRLDSIPNDYWSEFYMCLDCGLISVGSLKRGVRSFWNPWGEFRRTCHYCQNPISTTTHDHLIRAFEAARRARFEHGDKSSLSFMDKLARAINEQKRRSSP